MARRCFTTLCLALLLFVGVKQAWAQTDYVFTDIRENKALPITSQGHSGTCWSFSTASFLESEIIRMKGEQIKLSEIYFVRSAYMLKAQNYIFRQGTARFTEGGLSHDPIMSLNEFGLMPKSAYTGLLGRNKVHEHAKMYEQLDSTVKRYADPTNKLGTGWRQVLPAIMDRYLGKVPETFEYEGKTYTAKTFLTYTGLNPDDYLTLTSFTHIPFYKSFVLSIPANWANGLFYNLPLDDFIANIDHAIDAGFTLALDLDGTEPTFNAEMGVLPGLTVTQQMRQDAFENFATTDDHLVHIVGKAKDQHGNIYYKCKNSWGPAAGRNGFLYLSVAYMRMKGISVLLHKNGLTDATKRLY